MTEAHREIAERLKGMILKHGTDPKAGRNRRMTQIQSRHMDALQALHTSKDEEDEETEKKSEKTRWEELRKSALESMVEKIAPREDGP